MRKKHRVNKKRFTTLMIAAAIVVIAIILILIQIIGGIINKDDGKGAADKGGNVSGTAKIEHLEPSDIPLVMSEDGSSPVHPSAVIQGTDGLYSDSFLISNPDDITCIVNKTYNLPADYEPADLVNVEIPFAPGRTDTVKRMRSEASQALTKLVTAAEQEKGYHLYGASGYRSYDVQKVLFTNKISEKGSIAAANEYSAVPGQSEHQLGLAMDFTLEELNYRLDDSFGDTEEGKWLKDNCHRFGFILRYPKEKEDITGYKYEPWHCRYVGEKTAKYIYEHDLTYEEYYGLK